MSQFERFKEQLNKDFEDLDRFGERLYDFDFENIPYGGKVIESNHSEYDSYGNSVGINTIIYFAEFDVFIKFDSDRQSFNGIIWNGYEEVRPVKTNVTNFEPVV